MLQSEFYFGCSFNFNLSKLYLDISSELIYKNIIRLQCAWFVWANTVWNEC